MKRNPRRVSAKATLQLLDRAQTLDREMSRELMCNVYALADGSALLVFDDGSGILHESYSGLLARHRDNVQRSNQQHNDIADLLPHGEKFAVTVPDLIRDLPLYLRLDASVLDYSETSLVAIDKAIRKIDFKELLTPDVFASLTAYVGELMRRMVDGRWHMELDRDGRTWIPWIVDSAGSRYAPARIYKELLEHGRSVSMRSFVAGMAAGVSGGEGRTWQRTD